MKHLKRANQIQHGGRADNTNKSYESDLKYFCGWIKITTGADIKYPVSQNLILTFVLDHIEGLDRRTDSLMVGYGFKARFGRVHAVETIKHRLKAIRWAHIIKNLSDPTQSLEIRELLMSAKKIESKTGRIPKKSRAIEQDMIEKMIKTINLHTPKGIRNRAILKFAFYTGGRRRSEVAGALFKNLTYRQGGYSYLLHRSKTDQLGDGSIKILRKKHSHSLTTWIKIANITDGYLFRSIRNNKITNKPINPQIVNNIIKEHIEMIGENPKHYSAHGIRSGFVTTCAKLSIGLPNIMQLTGHKDIKTASGYFEFGQINNNPATKI